MRRIFLSGAECEVQLKLFNFLILNP